MTSVCFYFQVHQPLRLRRYTVFDTHSHYFDDARNAQIICKVADKCYRPATSLLLNLIQRHAGDFKVAISLTGCAIEQLQAHAPDVLSSFRALADSGCCEFLGETYYHSLAFLYSKEECQDQIDMHAAVINDLFDQRPTVFRHTELIYNNDLATWIAERGHHRGILVEGADHVLGYRSPNYLYAPPGHPNLSLLLKNYRLSDDIAFRFSDKSWAEWPLGAEKFATWIDQINGDGYVCNLFMDLETFGEHHWSDTGIFSFLESLPAQVLATRNDFKTPSECIQLHQPLDEYDVTNMISWADTERDLSAWLGNAMQSSAIRELYRLEQSIKATGDQDLLHDWRMLTTSDHFYYMCTKSFADQNVHKYFSPYESPYDSYINFMNVLDNLRTRVQTASPV